MKATTSSADRPTAKACGNFSSAPVRNHSGFCCSKPSTSSASGATAALPTTSSVACRFVEFTAASILEPCVGVVPSLADRSISKPFRHSNKSTACSDDSAESTPRLHSAAISADDVASPVASARVHLKIVLPEKNRFFNRQRAQAPSFDDSRCPLAVYFWILQCDVTPGFFSRGGRNGTVVAPLCRRCISCLNTGDGAQQCHDDGAPPLPGAARSGLAGRHRLMSPLPGQLRTSRPPAE
jgi:hypothetical protein